MRDNHMAWHFYVFLIGSLGLVFGLPWLWRRFHTPVETPEPVAIKLFGGPQHGTVHQVMDSERPQFFIAPYLPTEEDGSPKLENMIGHMHNMQYFQPSYAYYLAVTDEDYFYARDVSEKEIEMMQVTGEPIPARPMESDTPDI
jgi:hypothetical protein